MTKFDKGQEVKVKKAIDDYVSQWGRAHCDFNTHSITLSTFFSQWGRTPLRLRNNLDPGHFMRFNQ